MAKFNFIVCCVGQNDRSMGVQREWRMNMPVKRIGTEDFKESCKSKKGPSMDDCAVT